MLDLAPFMSPTTLLAHQGDASKHLPSIDLLYWPPRVLVSTFFMRKNFLDVHNI